MQRADASFLREYRTFRIYLRRFNRFQSLFSVWALSRALRKNIELPDMFKDQVNPITLELLKEHVHPWELDVLARELVLNGRQDLGRAILTWTDISSAITHLRRLDEASFLSRLDQSSDAFLMLHRLAHKQFPSQRNDDLNVISRYLFIHRQPDVERIIKSVYNLSALQLARISMAVIGSFDREFVLNSYSSYEILEVSSEISSSFFARTTSSMEDLRQRAKSLQIPGEMWPHTWNPLELTPLISFDKTNPNQLICPLPRLLLNRLTSGIFFDLVKVADFGNSYGKAFENYVGEVMSRTCQDDGFTLTRINPYLDGSKAKKKHSLDWILSDGTAHLAIEAKTKRLRFNSKSLIDDHSLEADLDVLAQAIVQNYANIYDILSEKVSWNSYGLNIHPVIVTIEDWGMITPPIHKKIMDKVRLGLKLKNLPEDYVEKMPYWISSVFDFEMVTQLMSIHGIEGVLHSIDTEQLYRPISFQTILHAFSDDLPLLRNVFADELDRVMFSLPIPNLSAEL